MNRKNSLFLFGILMVSCTLVILFYFNKSTKTEGIQLTQNRFQSFEDSISYRLDSLEKISQPIFGFRFLILGDFDGDKIQDSLIERYTDSTCRSEQALYDGVMEYKDLLFRANKYNYKSFLQSKSGKIKSVIEGGILGFHYVENCGDFNNDGKDDVLVVRTNGDWSNLNHALIYSYINSSWQKMESIGVWEWMFPPTPTASMIPDLFGNYEYGTQENDSINTVLLNDLNNFKYIKWIDKCWIEFESQNELWEEVVSDEDEISYQETNFKKVKLKSEWFYQDKRLKNRYYKIESEDGLRPDGNEYYLTLSDPASSLIVRINTCKYSR